MADLHEDTKRMLAHMLKKKADQNNDGILSESEIVVALAECGCPVPKHQLKFIREAVDTDGDGKVKIDELVENLDVMMIHDIRGTELMAAFKLFDKDGSGAIRRHELRAILTQPGDHQFSLYDANELLDEIFDKYDVNKDDKLSYPEFVRMYTEDTETQMKSLQKFVEETSCQQTTK